MAVTVCIENGDICRSLEEPLKDRRCNEGVFQNPVVSVEKCKTVVQGQCEGAGGLLACRALSSRT